MADWGNDDFEDQPNDQLIDCLEHSYADDDLSWDDVPEEDETLGFGEMKPPNTALLPKHLVPYDGARPGNLIATPWVCPNSDCMQLYIGSQNYICDLQTYMCKKCKIMNLTAYDWTLIRCIVNGIQIGFTKVYDQKRTSLCVLFAFISLCDIMRRLRGAKYGCDEGRLLNHDEMHVHFQTLAGCCLGEVSDIVTELQRLIGSRRYANIELLLQAAVHYGVPYWLDTKYACSRDRLRANRGIDESLVVHPALNVTGWFRVCGQDVETICRLLAAGIPLLAVVRQGRNFRRLGADQVYRAPKGSGITHAVVLHGSAVATPQGEITELDKCEEMKSSGGGLQEVFFRCRNSYGNRYHLGIEDDDGADFCVWASDITGEVYGIHLAEHD